MLQPFFFLALRLLMAWSINLLVTPSSSASRQASFRSRRVQGRSVSLFNIRRAAMRALRQHRLIPRIDAGSERQLLICFWMQPYLKPGQGATIGSTGWIDIIRLLASMSCGRTVMAGKSSISNLYFSNRNGKVFRLPRNMSKDFQKPQPIRP